MSQERALKVAPSFSVDQFAQLRLDPETPETADWKAAIAAFDGRFKSRYFNILDELAARPPAAEPEAQPSDYEDPLTDHEVVPGFVILSVIFLLMETLEGFRKGDTSHGSRAKRLFTDFLTRLALTDKTGERRITLAEAEELYKIGRCAFLHSAGSEGIRIRRTGPSIRKIDAVRFEINRTALLARVKQEFEDYGAALREPANVELRRNFIAKMSFICKAHGAPAAA